MIINKNGKKAGEAIVLDGAAPLKTKALPNVKYLLKGEDDVGPENATLTRVGNDLHVTLEGEANPALVLEGYFTLAEPSGIYGVAEDGQLYSYGRTDGGDIFSLADGQMAPVALAGDPVPPGPVGEDDTFAFWPLLLGGAALAGVVAAVMNDGGSEDVVVIPEVKPEPTQPKVMATPDRVLAYDSVDPITGPIAQNGVTNDKQPDFSGTATPGDTITIRDGDQVLDTVTVRPDGTWTFTPGTDLTEGKHSITVTETDPDGVVSNRSEPLVFEVDVTPPSDATTITISAVTDDTGIVGDFITSDRTLTMSGKLGAALAADEKVQISVDGGKTWVDVSVAAGALAWQYVDSRELDPGRYTYEVRVVDRAGNFNMNGGHDSQDVTVVPELPQNSISIDGISDDTGVSSSDFLTKDTSLTVYGKLGAPLAAGSKVQIQRDGGARVDVSVVNGVTTWSYVDPSTLSEGSHTYAVRVVDAATAELGRDEQVVKVDITAPGRVTDLDLLDDVGPPMTGTIERGETTDDLKPTFSGKVPDGATSVRIYDNGGFIGLATITGGKWSFEPESNLVGRAHNFQAAGVDAAGNEGSLTDAWDFNVSYEMPAPPAITIVRDNFGNADGATQDVPRGAVTNDTTPIVRGTGTVGAVIKVYVDGSEVGSTTVGAGGWWELEVPAAKALSGDGEKLITAQSNDGVYIQNTAEGYKINLDTKAPLDVAAPDVQDNQGANAGELLKPNEETDDKRPVLKGEGEAGSTITVYDQKEGGAPVVLGTVKVGSDGKWEFPVPGDKVLADGKHELWVTETDPAGNTSEPGAKIAIVVDTSKVAVSVQHAVDNVDAATGDVPVNLNNGASTNDATPKLVGQATVPNAVVTIGEKGGAVLGSVKAAADGSWSFELPAQTEGQHTYVVQAQNAAGTSGSTEFTLNYDLSKPGAPTIDKVIDRVGGSAAEELSNTPSDPAQTNDRMPEIVGRGQETGNVITVKDQNGNLVGTTTVKADGTWSLTVPEPGLKDGLLQLKATETDPVGNVSDPGTGFHLFLDVTPPTQVVAIEGVYDNVDAHLGVLSPAEKIGSGGKTNDTTPELRGTLDKVLGAGEVVNVYRKDGTGAEVLVGRATVDAGDALKWSFGDTGLVDGHEYTYTARVVDRAGNEGPQSVPAYKVTVDTTAPTATIEITGITDDTGTVGDFITSDNTLTVNGTLGAGLTADERAQISIDGGKTWVDVVVDGTGLNWSHVDPRTLPVGKQTYDVRVVDLAGNVGDTDSQEVTVVGTPVTNITITIDGINDDTGLLGNDYVTSDKTLEVFGKLSEVLTAGARVQIQLDNGTWAEVSNVTGTDWSYQYTNELSDGKHTYVVRVVDAATAEINRDEKEVSIDTDAPKQTVTITSYFDDEGLTTTGDFDFISHPATDDRSPLIKGTLTGAALSAGEQVDIYRDGVRIGTADVNAAGTTWSYQDGVDWGPHVYTAKVVDLAGNPGAVSDPVSLLVEPTLVDVLAIDNVVHEAALPNGTGIDWLLNNGSTTSDLTASGKFSLGGFVTGVTITLGGVNTGLSLADLAVDKTVTVGADTLSITRLGGGVFSYTYTLGSGKTHNTAGGAVGEIVNNDLQITATAVGGKSMTATGAIQVVNDELSASPGEFAVELPHAAPGVAITIILDASPSMTITDSGNTQSRWTLAKVALFNMLDEYEKSYPASTPFEINFEVFDGSGSKWPGSTLSYTYSSIAEAKAGISVQTVGYSGTNYVQAMFKGQQLVQASMTKHPDYDQKIYFITDGEPETSALGVPASWKAFVATNSDALDVYGVGLGPGVTSSTAIAEIKKALNPSDPTDLFIPVENAQDLAEALLKTLPVVTGNLFDTVDVIGHHQSVALGGDQGFHVSKVTIGGVDYTFDAGETVTIKVQTGLKIEIAKDGTYRVTTSLTAPDIRLPITFELTDADGDKSVITEQMHFIARDTSPEYGVVYKPSAVDLSGMTAGPIQKYQIWMGSAPTQTYRLYVDGALVTEQVLGSDPTGTNPYTSSFTYNNATTQVFRLVVVQDGIEVEVDRHTGSELMASGPLTLGNAAVGYSLAPQDATLTGTVVDDTLTATSGGDVIYGNRGNDTIHGGSGIDKLYGGSGDDIFINVGTGDKVYAGPGNDTIRITAVDFAQVDGGSGIDTLVLDGGNMHIDLSALGSKVKGIEQFDLGSGQNKLSLKTSDLMANGQTDVLVHDGKTQMVVDGINGDVELVGGTTGANGWTRGGATTVGGVTYNVYTNVAGTGELLVEDKVHVTIL